MTPNEQFSIFIKRDTLKFTASHWVRYMIGETAVVEPYHGHTFHVTVRITGPLDENGWVADFVQLEQTLQGILLELEHKVLVPVHDPEITISEKDGQTEICMLGKKWSFPSDEIYLFPYKYSATEFIVQWITHELVKTLEKKNILSYPNNRYIFQLSAEEETGYYAEYTLQGEGGEN